MGRLLGLSTSEAAFPAKINLILEKQACKKNVFVVYGTGCVKKNLTLSTEVVTLYMRAPIVQVEVLGLKGSISGCRICLLIFLAMIKLEQERESEPELGLEPKKRIGVQKTAVVKVRMPLPSVGTPLASLYWVWSF